MKQLNIVEYELINGGKVDTSDNNINNKNNITFDKRAIIPLTITSILSVSGVGILFYPAIKKYFSQEGRLAPDPICDSCNKVRVFSHDFHLMCVTPECTKYDIQIEK